MIEVKRKFYFFKVTEYWFELNKPKKNLQLFTSYCFINKKIKKLFYIKEIIYTIEIDLQTEEKILMSKFRPTLQRNIKKAMELKMVCQFKEDIDAFFTLFESFAKSKNIFCPSKDFLISLGDQLLISFVYYKGELLAAHSYIIDPQNKKVRLFQSGSKRLDMISNKNTISCANKLLMFEDMMYFKQKGYTVYDLGGYAPNTKNKSLKGINEFKRSFGGTIKEIYNYHSLLYYFLKFISSILDKRYINN